MYISMVASGDGTSTPRRCASHTPIGPSDAAASAATSILRGVLGTIIAESRITIDVHDRWPSMAWVGSLAHVSSSAMAAAFTSISQSPASDFACGGRRESRTHA